MPHHWLVAVPRFPVDQQILEARVASALVQVCFKPETAVLHQVDDGPILLSLGCNAGVLGFDTYTHIGREQFTTFAGVPLISNPTRDAATYLGDAIRRLGEDGLYEQLPGTWALATCENGRLRVVTSFDGYHAVVHGESPEWYVVGNRASLVAAMCGNVERDLDGLSWLFTTSMIFGTHTSYRVVRKVPPGHWLSCTSEGVEIHSHKVSVHTALDPSDASLDAEIAAGVDRLTRGIESVFSRGVRTTAHITGGKDSRAVLSLLLHSGHVSAVREILTFAQGESGDGQVARAVMKRAGLEDQHRVRERIKRSLPDAEVIRRFPYCPFRYEGQLTPYDGVGRPQLAPTTSLTWMGGGGEIYRSKKRSRARTRGALARELASWFGPYDPLGLVTPHVRKSQLDELELIAETYLEQETPNIGPRFYVEHRLSSWGAAHMQQGAGVSGPALLDLGLARVCSSETALNERIHYRVMKACAPVLLEVPFLNDRWWGATRETAAADGYDLKPVEVPLARDFAWQYEFGRAYWDVLVRILLERMDLFDGRLLRSSLIAQLGRPQPSIHSLEVKVMFGLVMTAMVLAGDISREVDQPDRETICEGNRQQLIAFPSPKPISDERLEGWFTPRTVWWQRPAGRALALLRRGLSRWPASWRSVVSRAD